MSSSQRANLLTKTYKVLKKHYKAVTPTSGHTVLEHLLFACCLEGAKHDAAEEAYAILQQKYFDWNEVRVTAIGELAEVLSALPDSEPAARRVRGVLQSLFEEHYTFDLEFLRKQNQGKSVKDLQKHKRITPFVIEYLVQCGFGGHSIPLSDGSLEVLYIVGAINEKDLKAKRAPGLERAISKKQGIEFSSLLHQLGTDYSASRHSTRVRGILLEIASDAKERLPKRGSPKKAEAEKPKKKEKPAEAKAAKKAAKAKGEKSAKKAPAKKPASKAAPKKAPAKKKAAAKKTAKPAKKPTAKKKPVKKSATKKITRKKPR